MVMNARLEHAKRILADFERNAAMNKAETAAARPALLAAVFAAQERQDAYYEANPGDPNGLTDLSRETARAAKRYLAAGGSWADMPKRKR
jgi:hypothetical protein